jgi:quinol monooxygenase YgiN
MRFFIDRFPSCAPLIVWPAINELCGTTAKLGADLGMMCGVPELYGRHGRIVATPGHGDALVAMLLDAADSVSGIDGCRLYVISRAPGDRDSVWVTEVWTDRAAHDASLKDERVRAVIQRARPLIASMSDSMDLIPVGGKGL